MVNVRPSSVGPPRGTLGLAAAARNLSSIDQLFGRAPTTSARTSSFDRARTSSTTRLTARCRAPGQGPARRPPQRPPLCLPLSSYLLTNTYDILIILHRARRKPTVLCEIMGVSIGPATISSPFSGAGALRVVYAPKAWISLVLFVRIAPFQWVTANPNKNFPPSTSGCARGA